jgi:hypothetical protein
MSISLKSGEKQHSDYLLQGKLICKIKTRVMNSFTKRKILKITVLLSVGLLSSINGQGQQKTSFQTPPAENRPGIFWDWMDDLITKKGITSDLQTFKKFGLNGTLVMLVGRETGSYPMWEKHNMPNPIISQTPEFFNMWKFAAEESNRLGLTITTQLGPGWCHSGGPWVKPAQAVQHLVFTETEAVKGSGKMVSISLGDNGKMLGNAYHSEMPNSETSHWVTIKLPKKAAITEVILHPYKNGEIENFGFPKQFVIEVANRADFSDAVVFYKTSSDFPAPTTQTVRLTGSACGSYVRLKTIKNYSENRAGKMIYLLSMAEIEVIERNQNVAAHATATASSSIEKYDYSVKAITDNSNATSRLSSTNSFLLDKPGGQFFTADIALVAYPVKAVIKPAEVIDLTKFIQNKKLTWKVPAGNWIVRRYAIRNAEAYNRPAPIGGKGLECDKLDVEAIDAMFEGMVGRYLKESPQLVGKTIKAFEADSWEVGNPEWTKKFKAEFIKRRGYDPTPWLITYKTKLIVGNEALTKRFLNDMYLTQTDLFADNFFSHLAKKADQFGMDFMTEPYMAPFDPIRMGGRVQVPTGEFWASGDYLNSLKWASSSAHTYGRKYVAAESFTGRWNDGNWKMDLYGIKRIGDLAFCSGVNKMFLHGTAMQPWGNDVKPGMPMFFWGTMFAPQQTWIEPGRAWVDYLSRCQYMLSEGINVADVVGLMPTLNWKEAMPGGLHKKYNYDLLAEESLLNAMDWKDGYFTLPSGAKYRVLFLPKTHGTMDISLVKKLTVLAQKGGIIVCQDKPTTTPGLTHYPQCDQDLKLAVATLWGDCDGNKVKSHQVGKGKLVWMNTIWTDVDDPENKYFTDTRTEKLTFYSKLPSTNHWSEEFLQLLGSTSKPDVEVSCAGGKAMAYASFEETTRGVRTGEDAIAWIHRRNGDQDIYFISNQVAVNNTAELTFRIKDKVPELWDAETGSYFRPEKWVVDGERIKVTLTFHPMGSVFVVFRPATIAQTNFAVYHQPENVKSEIALTNKWQVTFPKGYGAPATAELSQGSWSDNPIDGIKYFSGTATYSTQITITAEQLQSKLILDLGNVKKIAEVLVNNVAIDTLWKPPFKTDLTAYLRAGNNQLTVKITNTWWNRMVGDEQLPEDLRWGKRIKYSENDYRETPLLEIPSWVWTGAQRPSKDRVTFSTWKYVQKDSTLEPAGLIGPVKILVAEK